MGEIDVSAIEALLAALLGLGLLLLGMFVSALLLRGRGEGAALAQVRAGQAELSGRLAQVADGHETFRRTLAERLDGVGERVGQSVLESQRRNARDLAGLAERLALIDRAQATMAQLSGEVSGLSAVLSNNQARGAFGEQQMRDIIEGFLPARSVSFQSTLSNGTRVDALIHLPGEGGDVAVDAKFPLESWRAMMAAGTEAEDVVARRAFASDVGRHIDDIARKYLVTGETHEVALMFLPSEAVYAELHSSFPDVVDKGFRARVMVVSPTTFMATLHTMKAVMRDAAMREQAGVILREVTKMGDDVRRLDERVARLQSHFGQATEDVRQIRISTDKITRRADRMEELEDEPLPEATLASADGLRLVE